MGIYITGMEMPTKENAVILITPSGGVWMIGDMPNEDTHLIKAKAVPVPPHGSLIEKYDIFKLISAFPEVDQFLPVEFMKALYNLPTIIPASEEGE